MCARIENAKVIEFTDIKPDRCYNPSLMWVNFPKDVKSDYSYDRYIFTEPEDMSDIE